MTTTANEAFDAHPNVLSGQTIPNTLGGLALPIAAARPPLRVRALLAAGGVVLAGLALALALGRMT